MEDQIPTSHCSTSFIIHNLYLIQTMTIVTKKKTEKLSKVLQYAIKMKLRVHKSIHYKNCQSKYFQIWGMQRTEKDH